MIVHSFVDLDRLLATVPGPVVTQLSEVDVGRGRADLFRNQLPALLEELADRARIASITASYEKGKVGYSKAQFIPISFGLVF